MKSKGLVLVFGLILAGFGLSSCNRGDTSVEAARENTPVPKADDRSDVLSSTEMDFVTTTAKSHMQEIDMARLAQQKASESVKDFAGVLLQDHQKALDELKSIMKEHTVPEPVTESATHLDPLAGLTGAQFDREFLSMMIEKHQMGIDKYRSEERVAQNADLKEHIGNFVPVAESHLKKAQELQKTIGSAKPAKKG